MYMQILFNSVIFMQKGHKWFSELFSGDNANGDPLKGGSHRLAESWFRVESIRIRLKNQRGKPRSAGRPATPQSSLNLDWVGREAGTAGLSLSRSLGVPSLHFPLSADLFPATTRC